MALPYTITVTGELFTPDTQDGTPSDAGALDVAHLVAGQLSAALTVGLTSLGFNFKVEVQHEREIHESHAVLSGPEFAHLNDMQITTLAHEAGRREARSSLPLETFDELEGMGLLTHTQAEGTQSRYTVTTLGERTLDVYGLTAVA